MTGALHKFVLIKKKKKKKKKKVAVNYNTDFLKCLSQGKPPALLLISILGCGYFAWKECILNAEHQCILRTPIVRVFLKLFF